MVGPWFLSAIIFPMDHRTTLSSDIYVHGGNVHQAAHERGCDPRDILDFSANINPLGPPQWLRPVISRALTLARHYPEPRAQTLCTLAAAQQNRNTAEVVAGNGSSELLYALPRIAQKMGLQRAVLPVPCYGDYFQACAVAGLEVETLALSPEAEFALDWEQLAESLEQPALVILGQPGNPAGMLLDPEGILSIAERHSQSLFVIDEAFADFISGLKRLSQVPRPNIFVLHSLTKFYALPGLRLGLGYGPAHLCAEIHSLLPDWTVNSLALAVGERALQDRDFAMQSVQAITKLRGQLYYGLHNLGLEVWPGQANYVLCRCAQMTASVLQAKLLQHKILIRDCANYPGLDPYFFRVAVRLPEENSALLEAVERILSPRIRPSRASSKTPAIMIQGLSSSAGKSVLTAALCRIFFQDGLCPVPFKAQNMSQHSFITQSGGQIGAAQAVQARACGITPDERMNPVLLKPRSFTGSQVIVLGQPKADMDVQQYITYKKEVFKTITQAYDELASTAQVMVLEGAGSPGEVNLKAHDVVNMAMARHAGAKVLLVGDIDRGGVFASLVGTMEVLEEWERSLVKGFIINRFRGHEQLLGPAMDYVLEHTGVPTLGVIPYIQNLGLPEEDSLGQRTECTMEKAHDLDAALDSLAQVVRARLNMEYIYRLLG